ncbi:MAG: hypothetical protein GQ574_19665 [Crocinitomix sp.]|nr:hypothetical protein [Crocinitomix sp.]
MLLSETSPIQSPTTLVKEGIQHLHEFAGESWTDHNVHDPGVTILEILSYALADLNYRTSFDIKDLLTLSADSQDKAHELFTAREILPAHPTSISDYRKLILDLPGIRNVWIVTAKQSAPIYKNTSQTKLSHYSDQVIADSKDTIQLKGLYQVLLDFDESINIDSEAKLILEAEVMGLLMAHRNLGEDFLPLATVKKEAVSLATEIELETNASMTDVLAEIYFQIDRFLLPRPKFHGLNDLLEKEMPIHEIFNGPALKHGFLLTEELPKHRAAIHTSDIIQIIMDVKGVKAVRNFHAATNPEGTAFRTGQRWCLKLNPDLNYSPKLAPEKCDVIFVKNGIADQANQDEVIHLYELKKENDRNQQYPDLQQSDLAIPAGRYRNLHAYFSVQEDFPQNYGIGSDGLPSTATPIRRAQAKQLKAYLLLFEQLMANYQAQLGHAGALLSNHYTDQQSYFSLKVEAINTSHLYVNPDQVIKSDIMDEGQRTVRFLDHKLGRFAEQVSDYPLLSTGLLNEANITDEINNKNAFLQNFPSTSRERGQGFNYTKSQLETDNVSGLKKRVCGLIGIDANSAKLGNRNGNTAKGFHIIEHLLLRPKSNADKFLSIFPVGQHYFSPWKTDPYSQIISIVIPAWPSQFNQNGFRDYFEKAVHLESPAHLQVHIHWLSHDQMRGFEIGYENWLTENAKPDFIPTAYADALNPLIQELNRLYAIENPIHSPLLIDDSETIAVKASGDDPENSVEKLSLKFKMGNKNTSESGLVFDWQDSQNYWLFHYSQINQKMMISSVDDGFLQTILSTPVVDLSEKIIEMTLEVRDGKWRCKQRSTNTIGTEFMINTGKPLDGLKVGVYKLKNDGTEFQKLKVTDHIKVVTITQPINQSNYDNSIT